jgi:hypothetical protein
VFFNTLLVLMADSIPALFMLYRLFSCIIYSVVPRTECAFSTVTDNNGEISKNQGRKFTLFPLIPHGYWRISGCVTAGVRGKHIHVAFPA